MLWLALACNRADQKPQQPAAAPANVRATVVTIRITTDPPNRTLQHTIAIAADKARNSEELDAWRLYDLKANTVTFVDDVEKTYRTVPFSLLLQQQRAATMKPLAPELSPAVVQRSGKTQPLLGQTATQLAIRLGAYDRQLWIASHPAIPQQLFALMHASNPPSSPFAPVMREANEALVNVRGFPLLDRSELPYGKSKMIVERTVIGVGPKDVPKSTFEVPKGYRNAAVPAAGPAASAPPPR